MRSGRAGGCQPERRDAGFKTSDGAGQCFIQQGLPATILPTNEEIGDSRTEHGARGDIGADTAAQPKPSCILLGRRARRSFGAIAHRRDRDAYEPLKVELKLGETAEIV